MVAKDKIHSEGIPKYFPLSKAKPISVNGQLNDKPCPHAVETLFLKTDELSISKSNEVQRSPKSNGVQRSRAKRVRSVVDEVSRGCGACHLSYVCIIVQGIRIEQQPGTGGVSRGAEEEEEKSKHSLCLHHGMTTPT